MSLPGRLLYLGWHRPVGWLRDLIRDGGPLERHRTEAGRLAMEQAAHTLPLLPAVSGATLELHLLTGRRFWYQTAFCLWSFARHAARPVVPVIYDDGTLSPEWREPLLRLFPAGRIVEQAESLARLGSYLPRDRYPVLRERWQNYPHIRKLTDVHAGHTGWKLVLDSDLLFFRRPDLLVEWLDRPDRPLHAMDCETSYGYSRPLMNELAGRAVRDLVNVGLTGLNGAEIDWDRVEHWCAKLIARERTSYYLEQALVAMLVAGRDCRIAPREDYVTLPAGAEARTMHAVMHHYVAGSKRTYFQTGWREALRR